MVSITGVPTGGSGLAGRSTRAVPRRSVTSPASATPISFSTPSGATLPTACSSAPPATETCSRSTPSGGDPCRSTGRARPLRSSPTYGCTQHHRASASPCRRVTTRRSSRAGAGSERRAGRRRPPPVAARANSDPASEWAERARPHGMVSRIRSRNSLALRPRARHALGQVSAVRAWTALAQEEHVRSLSVLPVALS